MRVSEQWIREWVNPAIETQALADQLSLAGLEVDGVETAAPEFSGIVLGHVKSIEAHPDADKLRVCHVDAGEHNREGELLQIVCGAANVHEGMWVPVATIGARLPGGHKIKKGKLRGVVSFGMLCSATELGLAEQADGLMPLPAGDVGTDVRQLLDLDDAVIDVDLTPNRGDCLSIRGISREIGVLNSCAVNEPEVTPVAASSDAQFSVSISASDDCPQYVGRVIKGVNPNAETPLWMQERLRRGGVRSLGPLVDVTNYVLLELGQPMHAFDLAKLNGAIDVRRAQAGEKITLLNDEEIELDAELLVIADNSGPIALAGIMGGASTSCGDDTVDIFLESAYFTQQVIAGKARRFGLATDSSHRFERGVDPALQAMAIERATELLLSICGGEAGPTVEQGGTATPKPAITLRSARIEKILGLPFSSEQVEDILTRLGMQLSATDAGWSVQAPSWRFDIEREEDLIEELARVRGYDEIPTATAPARMAPVALSERQLRLNSLRNVLVERGYQEAVTYSFVDPALQSKVLPGVEALSLANPISSELADMRLSLLPGLLSALQHNANRQQPRVRMFETGLRFVPGAADAVVAGLEQTPMIAGIHWGSMLPEQWGEKARTADFFDVKADVEALLAASASTEIEFRPTADHSALHPGQSAEVILRGESIGVVGKLHPRLAQQLQIAPAPFVFELQQSPLLCADLPAFEPISRFPSNRRDLALVVNETVSAAELTAVVSKNAGDTLRELLTFDVYTGPGVEKGKKSIALGLILQDDSSTISDAVMDELTAKVLSAVQEQLGAEVR